MAAGLALGAVQTLLAALQCTELVNLSTIFNYRSKLNDLKRTVETIKAVLLDADSKHQALTEAGRDWVEKLKHAVYKADDLFDELITRAQQNKLSKGKISKKVCRFFSTENQLVFGFNKSREIKKLRHKLDAIADDRLKFGFKDECKPVKRREETCSYVYETSIIGREDEKEEIVEMLLSEGTSSVSFVSIVGMGGLGKTTLAQLVFNDNRIKDAFGSEMYWVCVSEEFGLKGILSKFCNIEPKHTLQDLQEVVLKRIGGKKYLLILDDVWEENPSKWLDLKGFLCSGGAGTRILVTTRSRIVAKAVDGKSILDLKGLSDDNSWQLFKKIAFDEGDDHDLDTHLVEIGKDIVKKCANVPLSIRVISSMLRGEDESKWEAFRSIDLANMRPCSDGGKEDEIMSTLMFSYYNLSPKLKSCFSFCAVFDKDYKIEKELLISVWMAQGYLAHESQSMEEVGEEYFQTLLHRCFFQDVERDKYDEKIRTCKMHDLVHDLVVKVAGNESLMLKSSNTIDMKKQLRHLSIAPYEATDALSSKDCPSRKSLRTFLCLNNPWKDVYPHVNEVKLVFNFIRLRVLHMEDAFMKLLPEEVGKLLHLRYLDVSWNSFERLPESITNLHNLQVLCLSGCIHLIDLPKNIGKLVNLRRLLISRCIGIKKLPNEIGKLVNLRILNISRCNQLKKLLADIGKLVNLWELDISNCRHLKEMPENIVELVNLRTLDVEENDFPEMCNLNYMPAGMNKLKHLRKLTCFVVGGDSLTHVQRGELVDLKGLTCLTGDLRIIIRKCSPSNTLIEAKETNILGNTRLKILRINFFVNDDNLVRGLNRECHETMLESLHPNNCHLRELFLQKYQGIKFPYWGSGDVCFPTGIVRMDLIDCVGLKHLSSISKLVCLKRLTLSGMKKLKYIEMDALCETFFPSLDTLVLHNSKELKRWWRNIKRKEEKTGEVLPSFPHLRYLKIINCERLEYFPACPHLENLRLRRVNKALNFCMKQSSCFPY